MPSGSKLDTQACKQIVRWTWIAVGAAFVVLMHAGFGWIGPIAAFLIWTAAALPLFLVTFWWQAKVGLPMPRGRAALTLLVWIVLSAAIPLIQTPMNQAPNAVHWLIMAGLLIFPVALTWYTIRAIDEHRRGRHS